MEKFVETLNNNPIFQLSLSSKELFHSNFLAWLAERQYTLCIQQSNANMARRQELGV